MPKLWMFRGRGEFFFAVLAIGIPSYYGYTIYNESKFNNPIVTHSISLLSKHPDVKQLLGSPLHYKSSTGSNYKKEGNFVYGMFKVGGTKGNLPVEIMASGIEVKEIGDMKEKGEGERKMELDRLKGQMDILKGEKKVEEIKVVEGKIKVLEEEMKLKVREKAEKYYIAEQEKIQELIKNRDDPNPIPSDWKLWSITNLQLNLPNGNKIIVVPSSTPSSPQSPLPYPPTYKSLYDKLYAPPQNLTQEQKHQYIKQKSLNVYNKYNTHRLVTFIFLGCAAMGALWYKGKYTLIPIQGTTLAYLAKTRFSANREVAKLGKYFVTNNIEGGRKGERVDAKIKVEGPRRGGYIHVLARYKQDGTYEPEKIDFVLEGDGDGKENNKDIRVDLK